MASRASPDARGCDAISAFDIRSGEAVFKGLTSISPLRLAAAEDFSVVVAGTHRDYGSGYDGQTDGQLNVVRPTSDGPWESMPWVGGASYAPFGGVAVLSDGDSVLVSTARRPPALWPAAAPFGIEAYRLSEIRRKGFVSGPPGLDPPEFYEAWWLGPRHGRLETRGLPAQFLKAPHSDNIHVITESPDWIIMTIDPVRLVEVAPPIRLERLTGEPRYVGASASWIRGSLSADGRYLVTGRGRFDTRLNVADLEERRSWTVDIGLWSTGTALNRGWINTGLLAVSNAVTFDHGNDEPEADPPFVGIYEWEPPDRFMLVGRVPAVPPFYASALAWSTSGRELISADSAKPRDVGLYGSYSHEFSVYTIADDGATADLVHRLDPCSHPRYSLPLDILTANGLVGPSPTPSPTDPPPITPTSTTAPTTALPTPGPTVVTPSPSPSPAPRRVYLPITTASHCMWTTNADIALVLDTSSSMRDLAEPGRRKLDAAVTAAIQFLEHLSPSDQAAIVTFDASATLVSELTSDIVALARALRSVETAEFTRIDLGIHLAATELLSERGREANRPAMILLSDGRSNPVPAEAAEAEATRAKADGITVFTVGFGSPDDIDLEALRRMASAPDHAYHAPAADDLATIYATIGDRILCPAP